MLPDPKAVPEGTPDLFREGAEYYRTDRGSHPRANGLILRRSADYQANFEAFRFQHMLSPRPVLMIVGEMADTAYFSSDAIANSTKEPKELFVVPGKSHIGLYDDSSVSLPKLVGFYSKALCT